MTPMTAAMIVAAVANIAAVIAMKFARRELDKADRAIASVSSSLLSRRLEVSMVAEYCLALTQSWTLIRSLESGAEPCIPFAISSITCSTTFSSRESRVALSMFESLNVNNPSKPTQQIQTYPLHTPANHLLTCSHTHVLDKHEDRNWPRNPPTVLFCTRLLYQLREHLNCLHYSYK